MPFCLKRLAGITIVCVTLGLTVALLLAWRSGFYQTGPANDGTRTLLRHGQQYILGSGEKNELKGSTVHLKPTEALLSIESGGMHSLEEPYTSLLMNTNNTGNTVSVAPTEPLPTFVFSKELFVRSVYFDDRPRDGYKNSTVFLVVAIRNITKSKLIVGCQVGRAKAKAFDVALIGETPLWRAFYDFINHEEVIVNCYDLPVKNGSDAYISYRGVQDNEIHLAASERPLMIPAPRLPPVSEESKKYNFTVVTCAKIFGNPPWLEKWLTYQKTLGIDHVHLDAEDSFKKNGGINKPYIVEALNSGFLTVNIWVQWLNGREVWYHNQGLIYEDCAFRFRGTYDYIILLDTDDFFNPRVSGESKIHYYINKYCSAPTVGSCKFKWIEFFPDHYGLTNASDADGNVTRRLGNYSHYMQGNPKSLHKTNVILDAATHYVFKMMKGYRIESVPPGIAYVAHVRKSKKPPKVGLRLGLPISSALHEHVISKVLTLLILFCCMFVLQ